MKYGANHRRNHTSLTRRRFAGTLGIETIKHMELNHLQIELDGLYARVQLDVREMTAFSKLVTRFLKHEYTTQKKLAQKRLQSLPRDVAAKEALWEEAVLDEVASAFPRIQRYALFTSFMGVVEHRLNALAEVMQKACRSTLAPSDLKDRGMMRSLNYLEKVCGFRSLHGVTPEIVHLKTFQTIRNVIVHADGKPHDKDLAPIRQYMKHNKWISLNPFNRIALGDKFIHVVCLEVRKFFEILFAEASQRIKDPFMPLDRE